MKYRSKGFIKGTYTQDLIVAVMFFIFSLLVLYKFISQFPPKHKKMKSLLIEKLKEDFFNRFSVRERGSRNTFWWKIPIGIKQEIASPIEVWKWIEEIIS